VGLGDEGKNGRVVGKARDLEQLHRAFVRRAAVGGAAGVFVVRAQGCLLFERRGFEPDRRGGGEMCSVLIVLSRALVVQGEGRFLALGVSGCFWGNKSCIIKYKVKWRTKVFPQSLLYTAGGK
jgi:hypothetical protein